MNIDDILAGSQIAGARVIRLIENRDPSVIDILKQLYPHTGNAFIIGITGSPGVGKSTLVDALVYEFRELDKRVAVIAVDPSSPYSGGAILGDRARMQRHSEDKNVFIRSMASRGHGGGLSRAVKDAAVVFDAMGYDIIIVETVGAGQGEFEIAGVAHSVGIVSIPGAGDGLQAIKAGILEIGDLFIVNKCDRPDADEAVFELESMLAMQYRKKSSWEPRVLKTVAKQGSGVKDLAQLFLTHFEFLKTSRLLDQKLKEMEESYFRSLLRDQILDRIMVFLQTSDEFNQVLTEIQLHKMDPISAAEYLTDKVINF